NDDQLEALIDVSFAHAGAPGTDINAYIGNDAAASPDGALVDALRNAVSDNTCGAISISFAFCGAPKSFFTQTLDSLFGQASAQGQAVFVSTGDDGAAGVTFSTKRHGCVTASQRTVSEMAADPHVTAAGGTQFTPKFDSSGNDVGYVTESVWKDRKPIPKGFRGATGGGISKIFNKPSFQSGVFPKARRRSIPDISLGASAFAPGFFFAEPDQQGVPQIDCCIGGTSLAGPFWAGITALAAQNSGQKRIGNINSALYALGPSGGTSSSGLHDITGGINSFNGVKGFNALPGYDRSTGWGTPDIGVLVRLLVPTKK